MINVNSEKKCCKDYGAYRLILKDGFIYNVIKSLAHIYSNTSGPSEANLYWGRGEPYICHQNEIFNM